MNENSRVVTCGHLTLHLNIKSLMGGDGYRIMYEGS